jgi:hypothetical protein
MFKRKNFEWRIKYSNIMVDTNGIGRKKTKTASKPQATITKKKFFNNIFVF